MFGLCMGNVVALPSLIIQREFAPASFSLLLGLSTAIGQVGYSPSPAPRHPARLDRRLSCGSGVRAVLELAAAFLILYSYLERLLGGQPRWRDGRGHQDRVVRPHL